MEAPPLCCLSAGRLSLSWITGNNEIKLQQTEAFLLLLLLFLEALAFHSKLSLMPELSGDSSPCRLLHERHGNKETTDNLVQAPMQAEL